MSFDNYIKIFSDQRQILLLGKSLMLAGGAALLSLIIGLPLAVLIGRTEIPGRSILSICCLFPLLIPPYIHGLSWIHLLGENGILNQLMVKVFHLDAPLLTIYGIGGSIFILFISYFPIVTLMCLTGLSMMDGRLEEASLLTNGWIKTLQKVTIPVIWPYVMSGAFFVFIFALGNYGVPDMLRVQTYPVEIFVQFSAFYDMGAAAATAVPLVLIALLIVLYLKISAGQRLFVTLGTWTSGSSRICLGRWQFAAFLYLSIILFISVVVPIIDLIAEVGSVAVFKNACAIGWKQLLFTGGLAACAALIMMVLSFFISYYIVRSDGKMSNCVDMLTIVPFAIPAVVLGIGFIVVWNRNWLQWIYATSFIVVLAWVARFIPFTIRITISAIKQIQRNIDESAQLFIKSRAKMIWTVLVPLCIPGLLTAWYIAYVLCVGELGTTLLVIPPGMATTPLRIYTLMHYGASDMVAAQCLMLIAMALIPFPIIIWIQKRYVTAYKR